MAAAPTTAGMAAGIPVMLWVRNPRTTPPEMISAARSIAGSEMDASDMVPSPTGGDEERSRPRALPVYQSSSSIMRRTGTVRLARKSRKLSPAAEPIRMLGGSPMSVAVPPMLDARIMGRRRTSGRRPTRRAMTSAMGVMKMTVVTLSTIAETAAVNQRMRARRRRTFPRARVTSRATDQPNTPVDLSTPTMAIIDASRKSTFRSSAAWASSKVMRCHGVR